MSYEQFLMLAVAVVSALSLYILILRRLADAVQPYRIYLAESGEAYLANDSKPNDKKRIVRFFLDNAFQPWVVMLGAIVLPVVLMVSLVKQCFSGKDVTPQDRDVEYDRLDKVFTMSALCANPLFGIIFLVQLLFVFAVAVLLTASFKTSSSLLEKLLRAEWSRAASLNQNAHAL